MKLSERTVTELANACRLSLIQDEIGQYAHDLGALEELAGALLAAEGRVEDVREALPMSALRDDEAVSQASRGELLASSDHVTDGYITVPRTVEES